MYWTERKGNIRVCAVGYCLIDPKKLAESDNNEDSVGKLLDKGVITMDDFKPEYRLNNSEFWMYLQDLHDDERYWGSPKGVTSLGRLRISQLKEKYDE